jgi:putative colanic acid biosysnthesis UDP-glucose lipid carrier transferase
MPEGSAAKHVTDAVAEKRHGGGSRSSLFSESLVAGILGSIDALMVMLVGLGALFAYVGVGDPNLLSYLAALTFIAAFTVVFSHFSGLYAFETVAAWPRGMRQMLFILAAAFLVLAGLCFAFKVSSTFSRAWVFTTFAAAAFAVGASRATFAFWLRKAASSGRFQRRVAVVGVGEQARYLLSRLREDPAPWRRVVAVFDDRTVARTGAEIDGSPIVGNLGDLFEWVRKGHVDDIVVTFPWNADHRLIKVIQKLRELPVHIYVGCDLIGYHFPAHHQRVLGRIPVLEIEKVPFSGWSGVLKMLEDRILGTLLTILFLPLMGVIALAIKMSSSGPILFRQDRYGFNNQRIGVYKFRTMYHNRSGINRFIQATKGDPRVTSVGRFLRKTSLDELPQLFNVLNGTMSLIGPRPHPVELNQQFEQLLADYNMRHKVKPGMTGWAQVNGWRGETETVDKMRGRVEHDIHYIENWSIWLDFRILLATVFIGWTHKNAY